MLEEDGFRFQVSGVSPAAGLKSGQSNLKRNTEKANTRLPCIVRWVGVIIDFQTKWLNLPHTVSRHCGQDEYRTRNNEYRSRVFYLS
jgi:hypothetical protein